MGRSLSMAVTCARTFSVIASGFASRVRTTRLTKPGQSCARGM